MSIVNEYFCTFTCFFKFFGNLSHSLARVLCGYFPHGWGVYS
nr:MAG TPA: hypothetical protein [Caudoviricetes sp.]